MSSVYFGGSRHLEPSHPVYSVLRSVVRQVIMSGCKVHVGCQSGADQGTIWLGLFSPSSLVVFAVGPSFELVSPVIERAHHAGASVTLAAGGPQSVPLKARYLLRSKAAFAGCGQAVFFQPGPGSLAVARECIKSSIPVFAFATVEPEPIPHTAGSWQPVGMHSYYSAFCTQFVQCWQWSSAQLSFI